MWKHFTEWNHQNLFVFVFCFVLFCFSSNQRWFRRFDLNNGLVRNHYIDVITSTMTSQITSLTIVLLNRLFRRRSKKTPKLCVTGFCAGNSPVTGEFPAQRASNADNGSIWWRHHEKIVKNSFLLVYIFIFWLSFHARLLLMVQFTISHNLHQWWPSNKLLCMAMMPQL